MTNDDYCYECTGYGDDDYCYECTGYGDDDYCYECTGYGDDYYIDDDGEMVRSCDTCPHNHRNWEDEA